MSILSKATTATLVNIKLTDKGREFLAKGFKDDNVFDIIKFSLGDSEIDYTQTGMTTQFITEPMNNAVDLKTKIYAAGVAPSGEAVVSVFPSQIIATQYQSSIPVQVETSWNPVTGIYREEYSWLNLGPLNDYDYSITKSVDTASATIKTYDTTGTTTIMVKGMTSGKYALLTLSIS